LYEQAKVEERRQTPSVIVLDKAAPAERKAKPKVTLYALIALVGSILFSVAVIFLKESILRLEQANPDKMTAIKGIIMGDWFGLKIFKRT